MSAYGMQVRGTQIFVNGQRLRHIGMNVAFLFSRELAPIAEVRNNGMTADLAAVKAAGFRFIRVNFGFYSYANWRDSYWNNKPLFWATAQRTLDAIHAAGLGTGVVLAWSLKEFAKLHYHVYGASQSLGNLGEPSTTLWTMWRDYVVEFMTRFASHPAIWFWVPCDEITVNAGVEGYPTWLVDGTGTDLGGGALPPSMYSWGTKPEGGNYAASDKMTRHQWQQFARMTVDLIHARDPHARLILSGNGVGSSFCVKSTTNNSLTADTFEEWDGSTGATEFKSYVEWREKAFTGICGHVFMRPVKAGDSQYWLGAECTDYSQMVGYWKTWSNEARKPMVMESFGASSRSVVDGVSTVGTENSIFQGMVNALVSNNVDVASAWNWGGTLTDGSLAMDPNLGGAGPEWAAWDLAHPTNAPKLASLIASNAARA